jgi:hypothetical protein
VPRRRRAGFPTDANKLAASPFRPPRYQDIEKVESPLFCSWTASPVHSSSLPFCVRFNGAVARRAATLDTRLVASSHPRSLFHPLVNQPFPVRMCNRWFRVATIQAGGVPKPFPLDEWPQSGADSSPVQRPWLGLSGFAARFPHPPSRNARAKFAFAG